MLQPLVILRPTRHCLRFPPPLIGAALLAVTLCSAPENASPERKRPESPPPIKQIGPGLFELGEVRLDKPARQIEFPGAINMQTGAVEYFLVTTNGKVHESVLNTGVDPYRIHLALLLLGANRSANNLPATADALPGQPVRISVSWNGLEKPIAAEEMVFNTREDRPMTSGEWNYNGSKTEHGVFAAQIDGSIVSIIRDERALINNPRPGNDNDEIWQVRSNRVPAVRTPVRIRISLGRKE